MKHTELSCSCGRVQIELKGEPIIAAECHCTSCRKGAVRIAALPGSPRVTAANGGTPYVLFRKDRVHFRSGAELIRWFRLLPTSPTRRAVTGCCNTPIFVEFKNGHWLSFYASLWPEDSRPIPQLRTQTGDAPDGTDLSGIPHGGGPTWRFYGRLLSAWLSMGLRTPKVEIGSEL
jgi:hypothetical protein